MILAAGTAVFQKMLNLHWGHYMYVVFVLTYYLFTNVFQTVTTKPMDTMKVVLPPERPKVKVKVEEKIDKSELQLMLFPGQIQKISNLITLLAHQRDLLQR